MLCIFCESSFWFWNLSKIQHIEQTFLWLTCLMCFFFSLQNNWDKLIQTHLQTWLIETFVKVILDFRFSASDVIYLFFGQAWCLFFSITINALQSFAILSQLFFHLYTSAHNAPLWICLSLPFHIYFFARFLMRAHAVFSVSFFFSWLITAWLSML